MNTYFMQKPRLFAASLGVVALTLLPSCQDEDFGYTAEQIKYEKAYKDFFGEMPADKNWDLSSSVNHYHYDSDDNSLTRANSIDPDGSQLQNGKDKQWYVCDNYWEVPQKTYDWIKAALKEGKDNRYLGSPFVLQLPENDFAIIPIFQGKSSIMSELEVKVNGYEITKVWTRSENIQVKDTHERNGVTATNWTNIGYYDGYSGYDKSTMQSEHGHLHMYPSYTDEADAVQAKPIYFRAKDKIGTSDKGFMYLSLHNIDKAWASWTNWNERWDNNNEWTTIGHRLTSINPQGHMLALNVPSQYRPAPSELPDICEDGTTKPSQVIFVSCEDANGTGTDHDVNDVAFLIIGYPNAPTIVPTTEIIEKRYMCEDLGGTYDYDFNDIVIDCKQTQKYVVNAEPNDLENYDGDVAGDITIKDMVPDGCPVQTAKVARLCGTIPLQIRIGDFMFPKIKDPMAHENQWDGYDGRYSTRSDLCSDEYYLYSHKHCAACCSKHGTIGTNDNDRIKYGHHNITRAAEDIPDNGGNVTQGWNPNEEQVIPCHTWDPDKNNIIIYADWGYKKKLYNSATVDANGELDLKNSNPFPENTEDFADFASGKKFPVSFPKTGEYPYIIATDVDVPWMKEEQHIPAGWINGDMTARSTGDNGSNHDLIGNSYYMENYPNANGEGYIWSGDVTGLAGSTGVTFANPSAELAGIEEAYSHQYFLLHVYAEVPVGEVGRIGLYSAEDWKPLLASDPDGYMTNPLSDRLHQTYIGVDGLQCATIYLTRAQRDEILAKGLVVASLTDGLRIKKITTARPCLDNTSNNGAGTTDVDAGFIINIDQSKCSNGRVMSSESERVASIIKPESGNELTTEEQSKNAAELSRASVPFTTRQFISGTTVTLTAIGNTISETQSYKVTGWVSNNSEIVSSGSGNPLIINYSNSTVWGGNDGNIKQVTVYPTFAPATNPQLKYADDETEKTVTLAINGAVTKPYKLYASSLNLTTLLDQYGVNNSIVGTSFSIEDGKHVISLDPKTVGETSFVIYQKDGTHNSESYGVSGELKLTVKIVDQLPTTETNLAKWMVYEWNGADADSYIISKPYDSDIQLNLQQDVKTDGSHQIFGGTQWGHSRRYIDLPDANWLVAEVNSGNVDFNFNKEVGANPWEGDAITVNANSSYCTVIDNGTVGKKTYIIDLKALRQKYGYVHLVTIAAPWQETANVEWIKVDTQYSDVRAEWDDLIGKSSPEMAKATIDLLASDIYHWNGTGESATVADQNGTVGTTAADAALAGGNPDSRPFTYVYYKVPITSQGMNIYGHKDSYPDYFVDLSAATVLVVTLNKENTNSIFFQFNKTGWGDNEVTRISAKDRNYCCVKEDVSTITYVVDLDKIRNEVTKTNYLHLNAITVSWGANAKAQINSIKVDAKDSQAVTDFLSSSTKYEVHAFCHLTGQGEDNATFGYPTYKINSGSMFTKDGSGNYTLVSSGTINTVNKVYVTAGANITITAPTNDGYNFKWSNGSTDYSRTETINADFTTYADYSITIAKETELLAANDDQSGWTSLVYGSGEYTGDHTLNCNADGDGYGHGSVPENCYADLSSYTVLKLVLKSDKSTGKARFVFNCQGTDPNKTFFDIVENGNNNEYIHVNHELETSNKVTICYVNLKAIKEKTGAVKLNCIKAQNGTIVLFENPNVKNKTL